MKTVSVLILLCIIAGTSFFVFKSKNNGVENEVKHDKDTLSHNYLNTKISLHQEEKITSDKDSVKIEISENNFKISSKDKHLTSDDINKVEDFIKNDSENMMKSQIYILGKREATFHETKPIFDLLKKYDLLNFKLIAQ